MTILRDDTLAPYGDANPIPMRSGLRAIVASFAAEAAGNYGDNDVISDHVSNGTGHALEFEDVVRAAGAAAKIVGAAIKCSEPLVAATSELLLFSRLPTATEMDDNAAIGAGVGAADQSAYLGSIAFAALASAGAFGFALASAVTVAAPLLVHCVATSLFGVLVLRDAETNETAGMTVEITLFVD